MRTYLKATTMACTVAAVLTASGAWAQSRPSLADRVAALEARTQQNQSEQSVELLNRIAQLESEVKELRALVEQMQNDDQQARDRGKAQYIDLDSRLSRIENNAAPSATSAVKTPAVVARAPSVHAPATSDVPPVATVPPAAGGDANHPVTEKAAYDAAFAAMKAEHFADSAQLFGAFVQQYPDSTLAPNAYYWMGESYYVTQNYQYALAAFQTVVSRYPDSPKTAGALLKVGYCQDGLKQRDAAEATLRGVIQKYPNSDEAAQAQSRLRAMSLDAGG
ncbi:MAG TPA: tol-pal system protein YbgF [Xanthomonadaceae bacterium]|jgi:tol-pal system protein YbgF|nr:tol-pal system protein YbgF [Xanthomonadaceae bacterium]